MWGYDFEVGLECICLGAEESSGIMTEESSFFEKGRDCSDHNYKISIEYILRRCLRGVG
jgi:hypothetical protein